MDRKRILVVEDDAAIRRGLVDALSFAGYATLEASEGAAGLAAALESDCDLLLLDLVLPGRDGLTILREVRAARSPLPVIVLTARGAEDDRVRGLGLGADDYVVKPFSIKELLARIEAVLRRAPERPPAVRRLAFEGGLADLERHEVRFDDGGRCELSERERQLLHYLACHAGRAVSRDELLARVWGLNPAGITTRTIDMHIARLREKLHDDPARPPDRADGPGPGLHARRRGAAMKRLGADLAGLRPLRRARRRRRWPGSARRRSRLERAEAKARRQAALEENLQLALWRMDSALAPLMAEESARPYFTYSPLYPAERAFTCMFAEIQKGDVLVPSPLLTFTSPQIRLHFQYGPDGRLSSPQVPAGNMRDLAEARYFAPERVERSRPPARRAGPARQPQGPGRRAGRRGPDALGRHQLALAYGPVAGFEELERIHDALPEHEACPERAVPRRRSHCRRDRPCSQGPLQAVWIGPALVLARRVRVEEGTFLQGCWLDWDVIRRDLLASVADLVPHARLEPVPAPGRPGTGADAGLAAGAAGPRPDPRRTRSRGGRRSASRSGSPGRAWRSPPRPSRCCSAARSR